MHVCINDARHKEQSFNILHHLGSAAEIFTHGGNTSRFHRHVHHVVATVQRIHDVTVLKKDVPHGFVL